MLKFNLGLVDFLKVLYFLYVRYIWGFDGVGFLILFNWKKCCVLVLKDSMCL